MKLSHKIATVAAMTLLTAGAAGAAESHTAIHLANYGGIQNWRATRDGALLIEGRNNNWYRATFTVPCHDLRFANAIGFVTDSIGELDKFSSVVAGGERCWFDSFDKIDDPDAHES